MKNNDPFDNEYLETERLRQFIALSPEKKMECLEEFNKFLDALTPEKSKKIQKKLREQDW